ncbi:hypothetical protein VCV18_003844 [Metarhizium anisopliae]
MAALIVFETTQYPSAEPRFAFLAACVGSLPYTLHSYNSTDKAWQSASFLRRGLILNGEASNRMMRLN